MPTHKRPVKAGRFFLFFSLFPFSPSCTSIVPSARRGPRPHLSGAGLQSAREVPSSSAIVRVERFWWRGRRGCAVRCSPCPSVALRPPGGRASKGGRLLEERGRYGKPVCRGFEWGKERCSPRTGPSPLLIGPGPLWLDFGFCLDHRSSRIGPHSPGQVWILFDRDSFSQLDFGPFWLRSLFSGRTSFFPVGLFPSRSNLFPLRLNARFPS